MYVSRVVAVRALVPIVAIVATAVIGVGLCAAPAQAKSVSFDDFIASGNARFARLVQSPVTYTLVMTTKEGATTETVKVSGTTNPDHSGIMKVVTDGVSAVLRCSATTCAKRESGQSQWVTGPNEMDLDSVLNQFIAMESAATQADIDKARFDITGGRYTADTEGGPLKVTFAGNTMKTDMVSTQPTGIVVGLHSTVRRTTPIKVTLPS